MMGTQTEPAQFFYDFGLDDHVPADHPLRRIDQFLELESERCELKPFYGTFDQPSIDPELMMRMLIVGYCTGIRSERPLCPAREGRACRGCDSQNSAVGDLLMAGLR